ncbi:MAG: cytochrome c [Granulosicoccus sp.]
MISRISKSASESAGTTGVYRVVRVGLLAASLALMGGASGAMAAGDAAAGGGKAHTCLGCHGVKHYVNTYPSYHVPRIAGQHAEYLVAALQAYRAKTRSHPTMQANAALLSDQDIEDIAAWFAAQGTSN